MNVAIVGATGAVGAQILSLLSARAFPALRLRCFASARSAGKRVGEHRIEPLDEDAFREIDLAFFCAGSAITKQFLPHALRAGAFVVDCSSALRGDPSVPLVIPEINAHALTPSHRVVASPNCAATIFLLPLAPLHKLARVKRLVITTYQAASGGGAKLLQELQEETRAYLDSRPYAPSLPFPYAFNLYLHNSPLHEDGYVEEERKILHETRKILEDGAIQVSATCVRVPVLRAHSVSVNAEFHRPIILEAARAAIAQMPGVRLFEEREKNRFPTPRDATGQNDILCGRLRVDPSQPNTLEFWAVGDQLLKGAALNAVQIAEGWLAKWFAKRTATRPRRSAESPR